MTHGGRRLRDTVETERDADRRIAQLAAELGAKPNLGRGTTLSQWWSVYQATKGARLAGTTRARYAQAMEGQVLPAFGDRDISTIGRHEIQALLLAQPTRSTASQIKRTWSAVMGQAVRDGVLDANPLLGHYEYPGDTGPGGADGSLYDDDPFGMIEQTRNVWDASAALRAMDILRGSKIEAAWLACIGAGLRNEEAFALRWKDVRRIGIGGRQVVQVAVHHAKTLADGRKRTKTRKSVRIVAVAEPFGARLWELRGEPEDEVCPLTLSNIQRQWRTMWEPNTSKHARRKDRIKGIMLVDPPIPYLPLQRMRATHETLMQEAGVLDSVNARLHGHSERISYRHYQDPAMDDAAIRVSELLEALGNNA